MTAIDFNYVLTSEAAKLLRKSPGTLRNWRSQKFGPIYSKSGATILYPLAGLREWLDDRTVRPESAPTLADARR